MTEILNPDDFALSFSEEVNEGLTAKIQSVFPDTTAAELKAFAANVLIGHIPARKLNECVGDTFELCGFYVKDVLLVGGNQKRNGKYTVLFGHSGKEPRAYATTSDKIYEALSKIIAVYGNASDWKQGIPVRIRVNTLESGNKTYSLEVI